MTSLIFKFNSLDSNGTCVYFQKLRGHSLKQTWNTLKTPNFRSETEKLLENQNSEIQYTEIKDSKCKKRKLKENCKIQNI